MRLDVIIPIYNEQENLPELRHRITQACETMRDCQWRVIYVNDGSIDQSVPIMLNQHAEDPRFVFIELSRNFGHQPSITAGLHHTDADAVVIMDGDLQDPPELIPEFVKSWCDGGKVVVAMRRSRKERGLRRLCFALFHLTFAWISDFPVMANTGVFSLLDRGVVDHINALEERNRFFPGLREWVGLEKRIVYCDRQERHSGRPKQNLKRLIRYALDGVFSFSVKPLRIMTFTGFLVSFAGLVTAAVFVMKRLIGVEQAQMGFTTIVTLILVLGGMNLVAMGLLGEYLSRVYDEAKKRPIYIVKSVHGIGGGAPSAKDSR